MNLRNCFVNTAAMLGMTLLITGCLFSNSGDSSSGGSTEVTPYDFRGYVPDKLTVDLPNYDVSSPSIRGQTTPLAMHQDDNNDKSTIFGMYIDLKHNHAHFMGSAIESLVVIDAHWEKLQTACGNDLTEPTTCDIEKGAFNIVYTSEIIERIKIEFEKAGMHPENIKYAMDGFDQISNSEISTPKLKYERSPSGNSISVYHTTEGEGDIIHNVKWSDTSNDTSNKEVTTTINDSYGYLRLAYELLDSGEEKQLFEMTFEIDGVSNSYASSITEKDKRVTMELRFQTSDGNTYIQADMDEKGGRGKLSLPDGMQITELFNAKGKLIKKSVCDAPCNTPDDPQSWRDDENITGDDSAHGHYKDTFNNAPPHVATVTDIRMLVQGDPPKSDSYKAVLQLTEQFSCFGSVTLDANNTFNSQKDFHCVGDVPDTLIFSDHEMHIYFKLDGHYEGITVTANVEVKEDPSSTTAAVR